METSTLIFMRGRKEKMKKEINVDKLLKKFEDMASRGTLLTGRNVTQTDLLIQIVGTIVKVAMDEEETL